MTRCSERRLGNSQVQLLPTVSNPRGSWRIQGTFYHVTQVSQRRHKDQSPKKEGTGRKRKAFNYPKLKFQKLLRHEPPFCAQGCQFGWKKAFKESQTLTQNHLTLSSYIAVSKVLFQTHCKLALGIIMLKILFKKNQNFLLGT